MVFARVLIPTADYIGITSRISIRKMGNAFRKSCLEAEDGEEGRNVQVEDERDDSANEGENDRKEIAEDSANEGKHDGKDRRHEGGNILEERKNVAVDGLADNGEDRAESLKHKLEGIVS